MVQYFSSMLFPYRMKGKILNTALALCKFENDVFATIIEAQLQVLLFVDA